MRGKRRRRNAAAVAHMQGGLFPEFSWIAGLLIGAAIGSFLNVVVYRMPRAIPLGKPAKSFCPKCRHPLGVADLFPLFSWLASGGKCRYCKAPVPSRYFWVELATGAVWAVVWQQYLVASWDPGRAFAYWLAASALIAAFFIDWELFIIPDQINAFLLFVGLGYNVWLYATGSPAATTWGGVPSAVAGALVGWGILWGITLLGRLLFGKDAMGHGDIKMARGIGAVLFPAMATASFALAVVMGAVFGVAQVAMRRNQRQEADLEPQPDDPPWEPEPIGSVFKCGLGYLLCFDVIGLFFPKFYISYFGEDPFAPIEEEEEEVGATMIPFGPYLALGAILAVAFEPQIMNLVRGYAKWAFGE